LICGTDGSELGILERYLTKRLGVLQDIRLAIANRLLSKVEALTVLGLEGCVNYVEYFEIDFTGERKLDLGGM